MFRNPRHMSSRMFQCFKCAVNFHNHLGKGYPELFFVSARVQACRSFAATSSLRSLPETSPEQTKTSNEIPLNVTSNSPVKTEVVDSRPLPALDKIPLPVKLLGVVGMCPFLGGAFLPFVVPVEVTSFIIFFHLTYAAAVLSFFGAIHFGFAIANYQINDPQNPSTVSDLLRWGQYIMSVVPLAVSWWCLSAPAPLAFPVLFFAYLAIFFVEGFAYKRQLVPLWFIRFKSVLTMIIVFSLGVAYINLTK